MWVFVCCVISLHSREFIIISKDFICCSGFSYSSVWPRLENCMQSVYKVKQSDNPQSSLTYNSSIFTTSTPSVITTSVTPLSAMLFTGTISNLNLRIFIYCNSSVTFLLKYLFSSSHIETSYKGAWGSPSPSPSQGL